MTRTDHPTADTVYLNIRQAFPNISLGTVYRNLNLLSEMGEIMKITTDGGADRFDGTDRKLCSGKVSEDWDRGSYLYPCRSIG